MFAVLHIADFALHAVLRTEPGLAGRPAALFAGTKKKSLVLAANPAARAAGVEPGMTAPQAMARCASLVIRTPLPPAENDARSALLTVGFTLSPSIEDTAPGVCTIDLKGSAPPQSVLRATAAIDQLKQLGLPATAGIAATPLLALYAARSASQFSDMGGTPMPRGTGVPPVSIVGAPLVGARGRRQATPLQKQSHLESELELSRPCPAVREATSYEFWEKDNANDGEARERSPVLLVTDPTSFLAPLPLATADPSPELAGIFAHWGLRSLGDLLALPRDEIVHRFGAGGLALWHRATGGASRPLHPVAPPQTFSAQMEFEEAVETLEPLLFLLRRFLDRLVLELRAAQFVAAELELTLALGDGTRHARRFRLPEPTAEAEILFRTLHTHLESLHTDAAICAVQLRARPARPLVRQQGLFETGLRDPHGFAETLARVVALVGSDRVGTPRLGDTHRPDAVTLVPPAAVIPPDAPPAVHPALGLPLRRFRPPLPARLELTDGKPTYLWTERFHGAITGVRGPWRGSGDWWQSDHAWQRTDYDIALADGGLYRLLLTGEAWFIEGEYD